MSIPTTTDAKSFLRIIGGDLDAALNIAIFGAQCEMDAFLGGDSASTRWPTDGAVPGDVKAAALILTRIHFEESDPERAELWRSAAQKLLVPYRADPGFVGAGGGE